jgi:hypothetical protein
MMLASVGSCGYYYDEVLAQQQDAFEPGAGITKKT